MVGNRKEVGRHPYSVSLNGISLADLDPGIGIVEVREVPVEETQVIQHVLTDGDPLAWSRRARLEIHLSLFLKESDPEHHTAVLSEVATWAKSLGWLTASWRPGLRLQIDGCTMPGLPALREWNKPVELVLAAYTRPYWEDAEATEVSQSMRRGTVQMQVEGQLPYARLEADIQNTATQLITSLEITVFAGDEQVTFLSLQGLSVGSGEHIEITYDAHGFLRITAAGQSCMASRSSGSSDEIRIRTGTVNDITIDAGRNALVILRARGQYY